MTNNLFSVTEQELSLTNQLNEIICREIDSSGGSIPFSRYMDLALYEKQFGYYHNQLFKFGQAGDFITAPLVSKLFAKSLSNQLVELFQYTGSKRILEIGSGNGQLMLDILSDIGDSLDDYYILDISASLIDVQNIRLLSELPQYKDKVKWLVALPDNFDGVIIGNEVLDAQPCETYVLDGGVFYKHHVTHTNNQLSYVSKDMNVAKDGDTLDILKQLPLQSTNCIVEVNFNNRGFMKSVAQCLNKGCVILIDYGYGQDEFYSMNHRDGTVRGFFRQHKLDDVLIYPGLIDITSSVDFTAIAETGIANGLDLIDYTSQGAFLLNCGMLDYVPNTLGIEQQLKLSNQINRLVSPNEMGEVFKVIGFSKMIDFSDWLGFRDFSLSYLL